MATILAMWRWLATRWQAWRHPTEGTAALVLAPEPEGELESSDVSVTLEAAAAAEPAAVTAVGESAPPEPDGERWAVEEEVLWHFRETILDRLDEYFACLDRLRAHDPDSYAYFAKVGFAVPHVHLGSGDEPLPARRPSLGGVLWPSNYVVGHCYPSFVYFSKVNRPARVQVAGGEVFRVTAVYDNRRREEGKWPASLTTPVECHVCVRPDGTIDVLKHLEATRSEILVKRKARKERVIMCGHRWELPLWLTEIWDDHQRDTPRYRHKSPAAVAQWMFRVTMTTYAAARRRIVVRVRKAHNSALFGIDVARAKYFFKDRDLMLAADGKQRRIFHAVRQHTRTLAEGRTTDVRQHFRGLRHFAWQGYEIQIVLPENAPVLEFAAASEELGNVPIPKRREYLGLNEVGTVVADRLEQ